MNLPARILYISHFADLSMGGQKSMAALIANLDRSRFTPFAVCPKMGELQKHLEKLGCPVFIVPLTSLKPKNAFKLASNMLALRRIIRRDKIDIVHPDHERDAWLCGMAKKGTSAKMIWHVRLTLPKKIDKRNARLADGIIGISEAVKRRFEAVPGIGAKYRTIFNGVDCRLFSPPENRDEVRRSLGLPRDKFILLFAGQLKEGKGIFDLTEAWRIILSEVRKGQKPLLIMAGEYQNDDVESRIGELMRDVLLHSSIVFTGRRKNIHEWMQAADALILPSHEGAEGMGRVVFEAMACGSAVIGTDITGINEALITGTGILIPERSPEAIAGAVRDLMENRKLLTNYQKAGRKRAVQYFDIRRHADEVQKFYEEIAGA